jgi:hypothetical protein
MPIIYDDVFETTTPLPIEIDGQTGSPEAAVITIPPDVLPWIEEATMIITLFDTEWPDEGRFAINTSPDQALPMSGNAQNSNRELWQKTFDIPLDPTQFIAGDNLIHFFYARSSPSWGYSVETLEIGVNFKDELITTTTSTTTTSTSGPPPTTTEPPPDDYVTRDEFDALAEVVDANSEAIAVNAARIDALEAEFASLSNEIDGLKTTDAELLAMIQRIESNLTQIKNCLLNSL